MSRALLVFLFDLLAVIACWLFGVMLQYDFSPGPAVVATSIRNLLWIVPLFGASFYLHGLYRGMWLFASIPDLFRLTRGVGIGTLFLAGTAFLFSSYVGVTRTSVVLTPLLLVLAMASARIAYRATKEHGMLRGTNGGRRPVLLLGAGQAGAMLAREINHSREWRVAGFLDDSPAKLGREILGHVVAGPISDVERIAKKLGVDTVILTVPSIPLNDQKRIVTTAFRAGLKILRAPQVEELSGNRLTVSSVRKIDIEDLLGRDSIVIDDAHVAEYLRGKVILVTGAGGSIGSELCRQLVRFDPRRIVFYESSEFALYRLSEEFQSAFPHQDVMTYAGDVRDPDRVREIFLREKPSVVFHAAAYKHVPMMENLNCWQAVRTNVVGTYVVAEAAREFGTEDFILVSTDKAVNPVNVMGATKRLAEMVCQALQQVEECRTRFKIVRFGNVLGSAGSVIPKFQDQIERGGPVTVTHPDVTRFFMSIPEAACLVLQAGSMGGGGEIFVMDMGQSIRIADLARDMIRIAGHTEDEIAIKFVGLRPGEKLFEEVLAPAEETLPTPHPKLRIARARDVESAKILGAVSEAKRRRIESDDIARKELRRLVPEYRSARLVEVPRPERASDDDRQPLTKGSEEAQFHSSIG
jgi:FlaA1/EpsC-like NDP-sugar epimerase